MDDEIPLIRIQSIFFLGHMVRTSSRFKYY